MSLWAMPFPMVHRFVLLVSLFLAGTSLQAQGFLANRSSLYAFTGTSGANLSQFNTLLKERSQLPIPNRYNSFGLGYQARLNDFIFGLEVSHHQSRTAELGAHRFQYRTSRALVNLGYSLTNDLVWLTTIWVSSRLLDLELIVHILIKNCVLKIDWLKNIYLN